MSQYNSAIVVRVVGGFWACSYHKEELDMG